MNANNDQTAEPHGRSDSLTGSDLVDALVAELPIAIDARALFEARPATRTTWRDVDQVLVPIYEAVFTATCAGESIDVDAILDTIEMTEVARKYAFKGLDRAIDAANARIEILADLLVLSPSAAKAACGRLAWARWDADVPEDLSPEAMSMDVGIVARHLARRSGELVGVDFTAGEAAWATVEGLRLSGFPVTRAAWRPALERAQAGVFDREEERAAETRHHALTANVLSAVFGQPNAR